MAQEHWKTSPEEHDFPAARDYLTLLVDARTAGRMAEQLRMSSSANFRAKDLLRASQSKLLRSDNAHVAADLEKVRRGEKLSPVLLVRGDLRKNFPLTIADGYHRICASYWIDENAEIPCRIIDWP